MTVPLLRKLNSFLSFFFRGLFMGVADLVPGISGATIALVMGIYDRLIHNVHTLFHKNKRRLHLRGYWQNITHLEFGFITPVLLGMALMIFLGSHLIPDLIEAYPGQVYALFLGIILASSLWLYNQVTERTTQHWIIFFLSFFVGILFAVLGAGLERDVVNYPVLFLVGAVALSAMILPGISGSYVLLIFGHYTLVLTAVRNLDLPTIFVFGLGGLTGLFTISKALKYVLEKHHGLALLSLTGLMLGAAYRPIDEILVSHSVSNDLFLSLGFFLLGLLIFKLLSFLEVVAKQTP